MDLRTPELMRLQRTARWNGGSILLVAALAGVLGEGTVRVFALVVVLGAWAEVWGGRLLTVDAARARTWLLGSQAAVAASVGAYAVWRLVSFDVAVLAARFAEAGLAEFAAMASDPAGQELLELAFRLTYGILILVTLAYQGGMAWYYARGLRTAAGDPT